VKAVTIQPSPAPEQAPKGKLLRVLGLGFGLAGAIGGTIGMGILRTPGEIAAQLPNVWLFLGVWLTGGIYSLLGALSVAELGTMMPRAGGFYPFVRRAFGDYAGFVVGWSDWLSNCAANAAIAMVFGEYVSGLFPVLAGRILILAVAISLVFTILHWRGVRVGGQTTQFLTALKVLAFVGLITACFVFGGKVTPETSTTSLLPSGLPLLTALILAFQSVVFTYDGWYGPLYFGEEIRDPERNLWRSMLGGVALVIMVYFLFNLALVYVLGLPQIAGDKLAAGTAAEKIFGAAGAVIISLVAILSLLGTLNGQLMAGPRILFAMSRDRLFSEKALRVNRGGTPVVSLLVTAAVSILFIVSGTFGQVIAALAFFVVVNYAAVFLAVIVLRRREPQAARPYRTWGYPGTTLVVLLVSLAFLVGSVVGDTRNAVYTLILLALSYPVFQVFQRLQ
jgi:APA family basic amino acid/polyamine antiporter